MRRSTDPDLLDVRHGHNVVAHVLVANGAREAQPTRPHAQGAHLAGSSEEDPSQGGMQSGQRNSHCAEGEKTAKGQNRMPKPAGPPA